MREKLIYCLGAVVALLFVRNLFVILTVLPDEANQGAMYRMMFFHIPSWWTWDARLTSAFVCVMLYAGYLWSALLWNWFDLIRKDGCWLSVVGCWLRPDLAPLRGLAHA